MARGTRLELVVVGGGPAGISTALHLAHLDPALAERTVVLEKERYPRDKYCAGAIGARAFRALDAIGVDVACPRLPFHGVTLGLGARTIDVPVPDLGAVVRRLEFDHAFAKEAVRRGIAVREGAAVADVTVGAEGVRVALAGGETLEARAVVGADGVGGVVRRAAGFPRGELRAQVIECDTEIAAGDPPGDRIYFDFGAADLTGYAWDFPTLVDGRRMMCRGVYAIRAPGDRGLDVRARLAAWLAQKGLDLARHRSKPFAVRGFEPDAPISRPRVLLVGEAAGVDIATGEGIAQAIQYGALAAHALADAFARDDLGFADWLPRVREAALGRTMRIRLAGFRMFYGPEREAMAKLVAATPDLCRLGALDFAGQPITTGALLRGLGQLAPQLVRRGPGFVLRAVRRLQQVRE